MAERWLVLSSVPEWEPIETAPKDGEFLVFGAYDDSAEPGVYLPDYCYLDTDGRHRFVRDGGPVEGRYGTALFWMPLPNPPSPHPAQEQR